MRLTDLQVFFLQTNHLRKFLEFRVGMGIVDNMVAKCKYVIVIVLVQLMEFIFSNLKWCNVLYSLQILLLWLAFIQWVFPFLLLGTHCWQDVGRKRDSGWVLALSTELLQLWLARDMFVHICSCWLILIFFWPVCPKRKENLVWSFVFWLEVKNPHILSFLACGL